MVTKRGSVAGAIAAFALLGGRALLAGTTAEGAHASPGLDPDRAAGFPAHIPVGDQFQVNTYTTNRQSHPRVSPDGGTGFVVTWWSDGSNGTDISSDSVHAQRFASDGTPLGSEFQVNTYTVGNQTMPAVSPDGAGGFVIAWQSFGSGGSDNDGDSIQAQRYAVDGSPVGSEFQVNTYLTADQTSPAVGLDGAGGFVVAWESEGSAGTDSSESSIQAQLYAADGSPVGAEFQVNTSTTQEQLGPAIGPDGAGGFAIVWSSESSTGSDSDDSSVQAQRFASDGTPVGSEFQVNTYTTDFQFQPVVGPDGAGGFVVAWTSERSSGTDTSLDSVHAQRFSVDGSSVGSEFQVNTYTTQDQWFPAMGPSGAGGFVVTWQSFGSHGTDSDGRSVQAQLYNSAGPLGGEFQVNTYTTGWQTGPAVSPDGAGGFVIVWISNGSTGTDDDWLSAQAQRYLALDIIFQDGFESGDTSAWSRSVP